MRGEENGESGEEEEGKHGGDEDPIREEVAEARSAASTAPDGNRHLDFPLSRTGSKE